MELSAFFTILSLSFVVALTGAMAPGPLLTYTIVKSARSRKRGYLVGVWVITGHALIEAALIMLLLAGFSFLLQEDMAVRKVIGVTGGGVLVWFGVSIVRDLYREKIPDEFNGNPLYQEPEGRETLASRVVGNPVAGGALVSMANPYWWIWWATFGFAFMVEYRVSFDNPSGLAAFFLGHEAGDLAWYMLVSALSFWGVRRLNRKVYYGTLAFCAVFMTGFGVYLGVSPFVRGG